MDRQSDKERERNQLQWHVDHIPGERLTPAQTSTAAEAVAAIACGGRILEINVPFFRFPHGMLGAWHATPQKKEEEMRRGKP
ncbi:LOW QUALITY PROTEIN: uncharacterized protein Dere_GG26585, partial [Drosophila erecta]